MTPTIDAAPALRPGVYRIDPARSSIAFRSAHVGGLFPFQGSFTIRSGELVADPSGGATGSVVVDAASFSTGNAMRDSHVRGPQFLDAARFPDIVFTLERAEPGEKGGWRAFGTATAHGVARPIEIRVAEVAADGEGVAIRASTWIDRYDFKVGMFPNMAGRRLDLTLDVVAIAVERSHEQAA